MEKIANWFNKHKKTLLAVATIVAILMLSFFVRSAEATCWHCSNGETEIIEQTVVEQTIIEQTIQNEIDRGTAIGIANNHQFNIASPKLQWSVTGATFRNSIASSFSLGKRFGNVFGHASITFEDESGEQAGFIGVSGEF